MTQAEVNTFKHRMTETGPDAARFGGEPTEEVYSRTVLIEDMSRMRSDIEALYAREQLQEALGQPCLIGSFDYPSFLARKHRNLTHMSYKQLGVEVDHLEADCRACARSVRLEERLAISRILGTAALRGDHTSTQRSAIFDAFVKTGKLDRMCGILESFGYVKRGKTFHYPQIDGRTRLPDAQTNYSPIGVQDFSNLLQVAHPDLLNHIYLQYVHIPAEARVAKAKQTRWLNKRAGTGDVDQELEAVKRARQELQVEAALAAEKREHDASPQDDWVD